MAVSPFAAPRDGEASFWTAYDTIPLGLPKSPRGDSFANAAPMDGEASFWPAYDTTPPRSPRKRRQFRTSQPLGTARPHSDLRMTSLRWNRQQPPQVATVSLLAAPRDGEVSF